MAKVKEELLRLMEEEETGSQADLLLAMTGGAEE